jgi:hypothetical protein
MGRLTRTVDKPLDPTTQPMRKGLLWSKTSP